MPHSLAAVILPPAADLPFSFDRNPQQKWSLTAILIPNPRLFKCGLFHLYSTFLLVAIRALLLRKDTWVMPPPLDNTVWLLKKHVPLDWRWPFWLIAFSYTSMFDNETLQHASLDINCGAILLSPIQGIKYKCTVGSHHPYTECLVVALWRRNMPLGFTVSTIKQLPLSLTQFGDLRSMMSYICGAGQDLKSRHRKICGSGGRWATVANHTHKGTWGKSKSSTFDVDLRDGYGGEPLVYLLTCLL